MNESILKRAIANIMYKASTDKEYRDKCVSNGKEVFVKETGESLPQEVELHFLENKREDHAIRADGRDIVFILPDYVGSLTSVKDEDLEVVVGGIEELMKGNEINRGVSSLLNFIKESNDL